MGNTAAAMSIEELKALDLKINELLKEGEVVSKVNSCSTFEDISKVFASYGLEVSSDELCALFDYDPNCELDDEELADVAGGTEKDDRRLLLFKQYMEKKGIDQGN